MDDDAALAEAMRQGAVGAHRPERGSARGKDRQIHHIRGGAAMHVAVPLAKSYLADGGWHAAGVVKRIATDEGVGFSALCHEAGIALSDSGKWACLAVGDGPEVAPDEK